MQEFFRPYEISRCFDFSRIFDDLLFFSCFLFFFWWGFCVQIKKSRWKFGMLMELDKTSVSKVLRMCQMT